MQSKKKSLIKFDKKHVFSTQVYLSSDLYLEFKSLRGGPVRRNRAVAYNDPYNWTPTLLESLKHYSSQQFELFLPNSRQLPLPN